MWTIVDRIDLNALTGKYQWRGADAHHPALLLSILIYGYAPGVYSSQRLQQATFDTVAFQYIAADQQPDHDTIISTFRQRCAAVVAGDICPDTGWQTEGVAVWKDHSGRDQGADQLLET